MKTQLLALSMGLMIHGAAALADGGSPPIVDNWLPNRCSLWGDSLDNDQAKTRTNWALSCANKRYEKAKEVSDADPDNNRKFRELMWAREELTLMKMVEAKTRSDGRQYYPTFGVINTHAQPENPRNWLAPPHAPGLVEDQEARKLDECSRPEGYFIVAVCLSSCYTPDQLLLLPNGEQEIGVLDTKNAPEVITLTSGATRDALSYQATPVQFYIHSLTEGQHEIVDIKTLGGKSLSVTENHPLLNGDGVMVMARDLQVGDVLINVDGGEEAITSLSKRSYFGKVYNVFPDSKDLNENIVVAQGLLNGSGSYQNENLIYLNKLVLRKSIANEVVQ